MFNQILTSGPFRIEQTLTLPQQVIDTPSLEEAGSVFVEFPAIHEGTEKTSVADSSPELNQVPGVVPLG